ncbi:MAG: prephenate dehydratase [Verrucomicrobiales bacterium]|nr:prephenate dehydratase [Verrucomicrobiales bacterium]|tara:strand:- start:36276 stop:37337 length:1062 start_codon:yes stop_codon:yes gene_type:complete
MSIEKHRKAIDKIDAEIVRLLNERTGHVLEIGKAKIAAGQEIYAPHRESDLLRRLKKLNAGPIADESLSAIYREVMSGAIALQKTLTIAYLGPEATFTHQAAIRRFGSSLLYSPQKTIADVFNEVSRNHAEYGVVPIENSTEGVVTHTLDMFTDSDLKIVAQVLLPIRHCLVGKGRLKSIKKLYSHPQAFAQCRGWLRENLPHAEFIESSSTTRAAELAAKAKAAGAIASELAAESCKLRVLEPGIQDSSTNTTRFLVLGRKCSPPTGSDRTSLMFSLADKVGALHQALSAIRTHKLNMTKIESRPSRRKAWEYFFYVDIEGHAEDPKVARAIQKLGSQCSFVKVLGSYPNGD